MQKLIDIKDKFMSMAKTKQIVILICVVGLIVILII